MNGYIICDNDSTEFIVIGTEEQAKAVLNDKRNACRARCRRDHGMLRGDIEFERHYWHIHDCDFVIHHSDDVLQRIRNNQTP